MGIINVLDFGVANLIAAGEVVDRPASVIKELLENSIDAGADEITVEIKRGGVSFMRVSDNGKGMAKEDMPIALKRHATSKIQKASDLDSISTLGFRGEALAAIASVSRMRIMSKVPQAEIGYLLEAVSGNVLSISEVGCPNGTTVIVENLFENVPARLKFLKKDVTEAMAVAAYVEKIALSHPEISIKLIIDGNMKFMTSGDSKLYNVIYVLLGRDFAKRTVSVDNSSEGIHVYGYIGEPDNVRANRNFQNFFINGRYIKSKTATAALEQAFATFIPSDKFPCAVLNIDINPAYVDVNVHPAKLEVKFSNERLVFEAVYSTVRQALEYKIKRPVFRIDSRNTRAIPNDYARRLNSFVPINDSTAPKNEQLDFSSIAKTTQATNTVQTQETQAHSERVSITDTKKDEICMSEMYEAKKLDVVNSQETAVENVAPFDDPYVARSKRETYEKEKDEKPKEVAQTERVQSSDALVEEVNEIPEYRIIGEAFYSYVFVEMSDSVLIIDKHAAHERIIFEELKSNMKKKRIISQLLLVPIEIVLTDVELAALEEYSSEIRQTGFEFNVSGNTVSITEAPVEVAGDGVVPMIQTMAGRLSDGTGNVSVSREIVYEKALFQASCKAAVKIGQIHDEGHLKWICDKVISLDIIKFCPHGRPVAFELTKRDFERQFKRI